MSENTQQSNQSLINNNNNEELFLISLYGPFTSNYIEVSESSFTAIEDSQACIAMFLQSKILSFLFFCSVRLTERERERERERDVVNAYCDDEVVFRR